MPLPERAEQAADQIAAILAAFDTALAAHITDNQPLPRLPRIVNQLDPWAVQAVEAGLRDINAPITTRTLQQATSRVLTPITDMIRAGIRDAQRARRRMPRTVPDEPDEEPDSNDALVRSVGAGAALVLLLRRRPERRRTAQLVRQVAREVGLRPPKPVSAYAKMVVRTETAIIRNEAAADIVDATNAADSTSPRWAIWVRDAMNSATDEPCERVDRKWATAEWARRNPTEHPNCTRRCQPRPLPAGARITLTG